MSVLSLQAPELVRGCHKALTAYQENLWAHLDRLDVRLTNFSELASIKLIPDA
jgi:hypothetical protein